MSIALFHGLAFTTLKIVLQIDKIHAFHTLTEIIGHHLAIGRAYRDRVSKDVNMPL